MAIAGCVSLATPLAALDLAPRTLVPRDVSSAPTPRSDPTGTTSSTSIATHPAADGAAPVIAAIGGADMTVPTLRDGPVPDVADATVHDVEVDAGGEVRTAVPLAVSVAVQSPSGAQDWAVHAAEQQAAAEAAMREGARQRAEGMHEGARQLRQGAAEMEFGAAETELSAATATDSARRRDILNRAGELRRQAVDLRRQADAMEATVGVNANFNASANANADD